MREGVDGRRVLRGSGLSQGAGRSDGDARGRVRSRQPRRRLPSGWNGLALVVAFFGVACFTATTPAFPLAHGPYDVIAPELTSRPYFRSAGVTAMALSTLGIGLAFFRRRRVHLGTGFYVAGGALSAVSLVVEMLVYAGDPPVLVQNLLGPLGGATVFVTFLMWWLSLASVRELVTSMRYVVVFMSLALAAGTLVEEGISLPGGAASQALALAASVVGAFAPLALVSLGFRYSRSESPQGSVATLPSGAETFSLVLGGLRAVRAGRQEGGDGRGDDPAAGGGAALGGMLASFGAGAPMFILGMPVAVFLLYASSFSALVPVGVYGPLPGFMWAVLSACALMLASCLLREDASSVTFSFRVLLPVVGVLLLGVGNILDRSANTGVLALGAQGMCYTYGVAVSSLAVYAGSRRFQGAAQVMACATTFSVAVVMMMLYYDVTLGDLSDYVRNFVVSVLLLDLVFLIASPSVYAWRDILNLVEEPGEEQEGFSDRVREACDRVARRHGLTPRETEILQYLGRGYGPSYLATVMPIKENTIRSHVRNIYSKLGVGSRAELLSLIDREADA